MTNKLKESLYAQFDSSERFNLAFAAQSRGDQTELKRLYQSCPRKNYRALDDTFISRMETTQDIALYITVQAQFYYHQITVCDLAIHIYEMTRLGCSVNLSSQSSSAFKGKDDFNLEIMQQKIAEMEASRKYYIAQLKAIHHAAIAFCNKVGISYPHFNDWLNLSSLCKNIDAYLISDEIDANAEFAAWLKQKFLELWWNEVS